MVNATGALPKSLNPHPSAPETATPDLIVSDASAAIAFHQAVFDATELVRLTTPEGKVAHAELQIGKARIMLADEFPDMGYRSPQTLGGSPVSVLLYVPDVDGVHARAVQAGSQSTMAVSDQFDGDRRGSIIDPFGHAWLLASRREAVSYEDMKARFEKLMQAAGDD